MFTITIGPARPRMIGSNRKRPLDVSSTMFSLARIAARHAPTTVLDGQQGVAMVLGAASGSVDLF
ncbi:hypothetical protein [Azospirillum agricola]|uniref:hypothetical protein n=1 Tax=Azospirillum agricola TaxID=1720247 RepID=UPI000A0F274E|nr:hypothetical protein [Azospirillum agricola]MBP2228780.1 hypothetical protein [Azospirillum agricola]SMH62415.1 hypothetical protein SAMN02982994_6274 [Azospirillum lipoferum]